MPIEIERKFLVADDAWRSDVSASMRIRQGYISRGPFAAVRVRLVQERGFLTIKSLDPGLVRAEFEYDIPPAHAAQLLRTACEGPLIEKTRHEIAHGGLIWTVDEFEGALAGLVLCEVELSSPDQAIVPPPWAGREVTDDARYRNENLAPAG